MGTRSWMLLVTLQVRSTCTEVPSNQRGGSKNVQLLEKEATAVMKHGTPIYLVGTEANVARMKDDIIVCVADSLVEQLVRRKACSQAGKHAYSQHATPQVPQARSCRVTSRKRATVFTIVNSHVNSVRRGHSCRGHVRSDGELGAGKQALYATR